MKLNFNRIAFYPTECGMCKKFIWLERYRYEEWYNDNGLCKYSSNICKDCYNKQLKKREY